MRLTVSPFFYACQGTNPKNQDDAPTSCGWRTEDASNGDSGRAAVFAANRAFCRPGGTLRTCRQPIGFKEEKRSRSESALALVARAAKQFPLLVLAHLLAPFLDHVAQNPPRKKDRIEAFQYCDAPPKSTSARKRLGRQLTSPKQTPRSRSARGVCRAHAPSLGAFRASD